MKGRRLVLLLMLVGAGMALLLLASGGQVSAQDGNLLANPSFEGAYSPYIPESPQEKADCSLGVCNTAQTPDGWKPWWVKERPTDVNPEYKPAEQNVSGSRVRSGARAAQYFSFWSTHKAGLRQTVSVPANATVQFSIYGHAWMSEDDTSLTSDTSGTPNMQIGIDPTGGANPYSPSVVWSGYRQAYDQYALFTVQARAQGDRVTVFTFSAPSVNPNSPEYGFKHNDIYWDDASLIVVSGGVAAPAPAPSSSQSSQSSSQPAAPVAAAPFVPGPTPTPNADGNIVVVVQSGDSLWAIAARAGITLDELLAFNNISRSDFVNPGDELIIGTAEPPAEEVAEAESEAEAAAASETEAAEAEAAAASAELAAAQAKAEEEAASKAAICLKAHEDPNQNGIQDAGESLRQGVAFTISDGQAVRSNYMTDGQSEPFCIELEAGTYLVSRSVKSGETLTSANDRTISLGEGSTIDLDFGSVMGEAAEVASAGVAETGAVVAEGAGIAAAGADTAATDNLAADDGGSDPLGVLVVLAAVVAVLLLAGVVIMIFRGRQSTV